MATWRTIVMFHCLQMSLSTIINWFPTSPSCIIGYGGAQKSHLGGVYHGHWYNDILMRSLAVMSLFSKCCQTQMSGCSVIHLWCVFNASPPPPLVFLHGDFLVLCDSELMVAIKAIKDKNTQVFLLKSTPRSLGTDWSVKLKVTSVGNPFHSQNIQLIMIISHC